MERSRLGPVAAVSHLHGKEGVDGSSPSEGFAKGQQMAFLVASDAHARRSTLRHPVPKICAQHRVGPSSVGLRKGF